MAASGRKRLILPSAHRHHRHGRCLDLEARLFEENAARRGVHDGRQPGAAAHAGETHAARFLPAALRPHRAPPSLPVGARLALEAGHDEKVVIACFLHDISNGALMRTDHGYWGAQLVAPYVSEEVALGDPLPPAAALLRRRVRRLQISRCLQAVSSAPTTSRPNTSSRDHDDARAHRWYMTSRMITLSTTSMPSSPGPSSTPSMFDGHHRPQLPPAEGRPGIRRLARGAHVAHDDLAQQLPVAWPRSSRTSSGRARRAPSRR